MTLHLLSNALRPFPGFLSALCVVGLVCSARTSADDVEPGKLGAIEKVKSGVTVSIMPSGAKRYVAGRWATVAINAENYTDSDAEETAIIHVGGAADAQFARRVWIPARSTRKSWLPFQIPGDLRPSDQQLELISIRLQKSADGGEDFRTNSRGEATDSRMLMMSWETSRTAAALYQDHEKLVVDDTEEAFNRRLALIALIYGGRDRSIGIQDLGVVMMGQTFLPPGRQALDPIDQFIIAGDKLFRDSAAVSQLRQWLHDGGRLWIMLDEVDEDSVRRLLGDATPFATVDKIELNEFELETVSAQSLAMDPEIETWSSDNPVDLIRVLETSDEVQCRINGWPVAFWKQVGYGEVLFTTLGVRGLIDDRYMPRAAYGKIADRFFLSKLPPPKHTAAMDTFVEQEIGYSIPSRGIVGTILGLHALTVLMIGVLLLRQRRAHLMSFVIPVAAVTTGGLLVYLGISNTSSIPSTVATGQIAKFSRAGSEARIESVSAIYTPNSAPLKVESAPDTVTVLRQTDWDASKRLVWTDDGGSNWQNVTQPPGALRYTDSESTLSFAQPWFASGTFTDEGFEGRLVGVESKGHEDGVIASIAGPSLAVDFRDDKSKSFSAGAENTLAHEQFIDTSLVSDVQHRRQDILQRLSKSEIPLFDKQPSLLLWTDPIGAPASFNNEFAKRGTALVSIPIRYERPASGSSFRIPASFVRMDTVSDSGIGSTVFNPRNGRWIDDFNKRSKTEFQCGIPKELMPCKLTSIKVAVRMSAPKRSLVLGGKSGGRPVKLFEKMNPTGLQEIEITDPAVLALDEQGRMLLSVEVSATEEELAKEQQKKKLDEKIEAAGMAGQIGGGIQLPGFNRELPQMTDEQRAIAEQVREAQNEGRRQAFDQSRDTWRIEFIRVTMTGETL